MTPCTFKWVGQVCLREDKITETLLDKTYNIYNSPHFPFTLPSLAPSLQASDVVYMD